MNIFFFRKYRLLKKEEKAALWYMVSNICQKVAPWLVMIILTHKLSLEEYGLYTVYLSWQQIIEIFVTLKSYSSGLITKLIKNDKDKKIYIGNIYLFTIFSFLIWGFIFSVLNNSVISYTELPFELLLLILISCISTSNYEVWNSQQRVNDNYINILRGTILYSVIGPIIGALTAYVCEENIVLVIIGVRAIIQFIISSYLISRQIIYIKLGKLACLYEIFKYNLPLLPYYLSMILLNNIDKILIQKICSYEEAAIYSVARSLSMILFVVSGSLNLSLQTWLYRNLRDKTYNNIELLSKCNYIVGISSVLIIMLSPEILWIMGGNKYVGALDVINPLIISIYIMFVSQQYINLLLFYFQTKIIMWISCLACISNILMNYLLLSKFTYIISGYLALLSCFITAIYTYFYSKKISYENDIVFSRIFKLKQVIYFFVILIIISVMMSLYLYNNYLRVFIVIIILLYMYLYNNMYLLKKES